MCVLVHSPELSRSPRKCTAAPVPIRLGSKSLTSSADAAARALACRQPAPRSFSASIGIRVRGRHSRPIFLGRSFLREMSENFAPPLAPFLEADQSGHWLFSACAPCQPFSRQRRSKRKNDDRAPLLWELIRFVRRYRPSYVFVENVPGLQSLSQQLGPFDRFVAALRRFGYSVDSGIVEARSFGVPQRRGRLVLVASKLGDAQLLAPTHGPSTPRPRFSTVWDWIGDLPPIAAGEAHSDVPNHRAMRLSPLNLKRIRATPEGGGRRDWPNGLRLRCHSSGYSGHSDVYGRMRKHLPASGLTTRCLSLSNGRFGHPTQDRAISVREAASLQTFPRDFIFHGNLEAMATQIGNAVPVLLAQRFGDWFVEDARRYEGLGQSTRAKVARGT